VNWHQLSEQIREALSERREDTLAARITDAVAEWIGEDTISKLTGQAILERLEVLDMNVNQL
jgi:hypothetical protein